MPIKAYAQRGEGIAYWEETTSETYGRKHKLGITPAATATFDFLFGLAPGSGYTTKEGRQLPIIAGTSLTDTQAFDWMGSLNNHDNFRTKPCIWPHQASLTSGAERIIETRAYGRDSNASGGAGGNGLIAFEGLTGVEYAAQDTEQSQAGTTWGDKLTKTFTPSAQQDYLIIAAGRKWSSTTASSGRAKSRLLVDGIEESRDEAGSYQAGGLNYSKHPYSHVVVKNLTAASHTIKIQLANAQSFYTCYSDYLRIWCCPLNQFDSYSYTTAADYTLTASYADAISKSLIDTDRIYLIVAAGEFDGTGECSLRIKVTGASLDRYYCDNLHHGLGTSGHRGAISLLAFVKIEGGAARTVSLQAKGSGTLRNLRLVTIKINDQLQKLETYFRSCVKVSSDDAEVNVTDGAVTTDDAYQLSGKDAFSDEYHSTHRWSDVRLEQGETIEEAGWVPYVYTDNSISLRLKFFNEDNTATFSTWADYNARTKTTASLDWNPAGTNWQESLDIKTIIQEVINRVGWNHGNALGLNASGELAGVNQYNQFQGEEYSTSQSRGANIWIRQTETVAKGTNYTQTLTEALPLVDSVLKEPRKPLSENVTLVDTITRLPQKVFAEAVTLVDTIAKQAARTLSEVVSLVDTALNQAGKVLSEAIALVDTKQTIATLQRTYNETITLVDSIAKQVGRSLSEAIALIDAITRQAGKTLSEAVTLIDNVARSVTRVFSEVVTLADTLAKQAGRTLSEVITLVDQTIERTITKVLTELTTLVDTIAKTLVIKRTLEEIITLADTISRQVVRVFSEALSLVDTIARQAGKNLSDALALVDTLASKITAKTLFETTTLVDTVSRTTTRILTEAINLVDSIAKTANKNLAEAVSLVDSITNKITAKVLTETVNLVDSAARGIARILTEAVALADSVSNRAGKILTDALSLADDLLLQAGKVLSDTLTLVDSLRRDAVKVLIEQLPIVDTVNRGIVRAYTETITLADTIANRAGKVLADSLVLADSVIRQAGKTLIEQIALIDTIARGIVRVFQESITLSDTVAKTTARVYQETITLADTIAKQLTKVLQEAVSLVDTLRIQTAKTLSEAISLADTFSRGITRVLQEAVMLTDTANKQLQRTLTEVVSIVDALVDATIVSARSIGNFILYNLYNLVKTIKQTKLSYTLYQPKVEYTVKSPNVTYIAQSPVEGKAITIALNKK